MKEHILEDEKLYIIIFIMSILCIKLTG